MSAEFEALVAEVSDGHFGHREHVHATWLAVRRHGVVGATEMVSEGIRDAAADAGRPQKYHATVSRAWVLLVAHHLDETPDLTFEQYAEHHPALLDKRLLTRFYSSRTLAGAPARRGWVEPDVAPFPF